MNCYIDKSNGSQVRNGSVSGEIASTEDTTIGARPDFGGKIKSGIKTALLTVLAEEVNQAWVESLFSELYIMNLDKNKNQLNVNI